MIAARIRMARPADVAAIIEFEEHFPSDRMSAATVRRFLRVPSAKVWVAESSGAVLGSAVLLTRRNSGIARIYSIVVSPAARGQGLARKLVGAIEKHARAAGLQTLSLEVRQDNAAAQALYAKLGYAVAAKLLAYYDDGADGLRLRKSLSV